MPNGKPALIEPRRFAQLLRWRRLLHFAAKSLDRSRASTKKRYGWDSGQRASEHLEQVRKALDWLLEDLGNDA